MSDETTKDQAAAAPPAAEVADSPVEQAKTESESPAQPGDAAEKTSEGNGRDVKDRKGNGYKKNHAKSRFDASLLPDTDDPEEIRTQVSSSEASAQRQRGLCPGYCADRSP